MRSEHRAQDNSSQTDGRLQLRFTRKLRHRPEKVWQAKAGQRPDHVLAAWFPTEITGDRAPGAALRFTFRPWRGPEYRRPDAKLRAAVAAQDMLGQ